MPIIEQSSYHPTFISNKHFLTIYASKIRKVKKNIYYRERILTYDNDFIDLDWSIQKSENLAILCHGLEGHSNRTYINGMINAINNYWHEERTINFIRKNI